ncbi:unnamed protein product [Allacma fusca]|uniref:Uncharacterized protein n=1 Tax=Allacma fusca TaxID=39272 RepID=A0A8J2KVI5_9HEXA|nr:unnamed protein product [Allacma fusca]
MYICRVTSGGVEGSRAVNGIPVAAPRSSCTQRLANNGPSPSPYANNIVPPSSSNSNVISGTVNGTETERPVNSTALLDHAVACGGHYLAPFREFPVSESPSLKQVFGLGSFTCGIYTWMYTFTPLGGGESWRFSIHYELLSSREVVELLLFFFIVVVHH